MTDTNLLSGLFTPAHSSLSFRGGRLFTEQRTERRRAFVEDGAVVQVQRVQTDAVLTAGAAGTVHTGTEHQPPGRHQRLFNARRPVSASLLVLLGLGGAVAVAGAVAAGIRCAGGGGSGGGLRRSRPRLTALVSAHPLQEALLQSRHDGDHLERVYVLDTNRQSSPREACTLQCDTATYPCSSADDFPHQIKLWNCLFVDAVSII